MSVAPSPFNKFEKYSDAENEVAKYVKLYDSLTYNKSLMNSFPPTYADYVNTAGSEAYKAAVEAKMLEEVLRPAAPVATQAFMLSERVQNFLHDYFNQMEEDLDYSEFTASGSKLSDPAMGVKYLEEVIKFRKDFEHVFKVPGVQTLEGDTKSTLHVGSDLDTLRTMLKDMEARLKGMVESTTKPEFGEKVYTALTINMSYPIIDPFKKSHRATEINGVKHRLLSSGLCYLKKARPDQYKEILEIFEDLKDKSKRNEVEEENLKLLKEIFSEMTQIEEAESDAQSGFSAQMMNIDPVFLSFFFIYKICKLNVRQFYIFQRYLYAICSHIRGKGTIKTMLASFSQTHRFISNISSNMSESTEMYLPPWVMKPARLYDMAGVVGCCDCANIRASISKPAMSWRYLLGIKTDTPGYFSLISAMFNIERMEQESDNIFLSEKILHQTILGRVGVMTNTNNVKGNFRNVDLVNGTTGGRKTGPKYARLTGYSPLAFFYRGRYSRGEISESELRSIPDDANAVTLDQWYFIGKATKDIDSMESAHSSVVAMKKSKKKAK